jgi:CheY-like chemotaxis protein
MNVLVVTDESDAMWYAGAGLSGRGFTVRVASGCEEALRSATDAPPDVVLMDFDTPGVDGAALAWALRAQPRPGHAPLLVVAVRGVSSKEAEAAAEQPAAELSLTRAGAGVGGLVVGVLSRFREFLVALPDGRETPTAAGQFAPPRPLPVRPTRPAGNVHAPRQGDLRCRVS